MAVTVCKHIIGLPAARKKDSTHELEGCLYAEWNYTPDQARRLNPASMEWMAVPFYDADHDRVEAILYLDASKRNFFTPARQEIVLLAVGGRYGQRVTEIILPCREPRHRERTEQGDPCGL